MKCRTCQQPISRGVYCSGSCAWSPLLKDANELERERGRNRMLGAERDQAAEQLRLTEAANLRLIEERDQVRAALGVGEDADLVEAVQGCVWAREHGRLAILALNERAKADVAERDQLRARCEESEAHARRLLQDCDRSRVEVAELRARLAECERERDEARGIAGDYMALLGRSQAAEQDLAARVERARELLLRYDNALQVAVGYHARKASYGGVGLDFHAFTQTACAAAREALAALTAAPAVAPGDVVDALAYWRSEISEATRNAWRKRKAAPAEAPGRNPRATLPPCDHDECGPTACKAPGREGPGEPRGINSTDDDVASIAAALADAYYAEGLSRGYFTSACDVLRRIEVRLAPAAPARDESVPPPGWERYTFRDDDGVLCEALHVRRAHAHITVTLANAWRIYDAEHGYAPAAPASEPALPEGWTAGYQDANRGTYFCGLSTISIHADGCVYAAGGVDATELHAVLAHHLATRKATP